MAAMNHACLSGQSAPRFSRSFLALVISCLILSPAVAEETLTKDRAFTIAKEFGRCAGYYEALSDFARRTGKPNQADHAHGVSLGSATAAAMIVAPFVKGNPYHLADALRTSEIPRWKMLFTTPSEAGSLEILNQGEICKDLNPLQVELVDMARRQWYGLD